ncbi:MAG: hypothetical protein LBC40_09075 [Dysgonamonadaceae bacterium]|nr:hypothetical protein [Dysgonamonadaceae bacterium]
MIFRPPVCRCIRFNQWIIINTGFYRRRDESRLYAKSPRLPAHATQALPLPRLPRRTSPQPARKTGGHLPVIQLSLRRIIGWLAALLAYANHLSTNICERLKNICEPPVSLYHTPAKAPEDPATTAANSVAIHRNPGKPRQDRARQPQTRAGTTLVAAALPLNRAEPPDRLGKQTAKFNRSNAQKRKYFTTFAPLTI